MPAISLVVSLYKERDQLERLLHETAGLYDDLVVIHDGPEQNSDSSISVPAEIKDKPSPIDYSKLNSQSELPQGYSNSSDSPKPGSIHELVTRSGGKYFEGARCFQQEPHWPFAWSQANHDWILRLDADEFPSAELKGWLTNFRQSHQTDASISGYTCIWPIWNGKKAVTQHWPAGRNFLFHRQRVHFFGMVEQVPIADDHYEFLPLILCHQPRRRSHGFRNILVRKQGSLWRAVIARSLLDRPQDLPQWRWGNRDWPEFWRLLRGVAITPRLYFLSRNILSTLRHQWRTERKIMPLVAAATPLHHFLISTSLHRMQKARLSASGTAHKGSHAD